MQEQIIVDFCVKRIQELIVELQKNRFENQGQFNDNPKWNDNQSGVKKGYKKFNNDLYPRKTVQQDKGRNQPLVDSGRLKSQLENPANWDLKAEFNNGKLNLRIPEVENFTSPEYDILETDHHVDGYISKKGNFIGPLDVPARSFKHISDADIEWLLSNLVTSISSKFNGNSNE